MSEIRLICPGCGADYTLPVAAIPESGREVECATCGRVWLARRDADSAEATQDQDRPAAEATEADRPQPVMPSKRLAPDMLQMLKDEVEHERRLREAEGQARFRPVGSEPLDSDWPATTVTLPAAATGSRTSTGATVIRHRPQNRIDQSIPEATTPEQPRPEAPPAGLTDAEDTARPATPHAPISAAPARKARGSYAAGLVLMLGVAAAIVALYVAAPHLAQGGALADTLMEWRAGLDRARLWLDGQAARLLG